ncbi:MAG: hypothetical protein AAF773_15445 [Cyanobacteria bacterium P01_D01_bin.115]
MENISKSLNLLLARLSARHLAGTRRWRWVRWLLLTEASLLLLMIGSAGLVIAWFMINDATPSPASLDAPARQPAANLPPCIVHSAETALVSDRTCISVN